MTFTATGRLETLGTMVHFQFNPSVPISPEIAGFKKNTTLKDRVHCVCIVIDGSTAGVLPEKMLEKIKAIQAKMNLISNVSYSVRVYASQFHQVE